ncbi:MAG: PIN domain-containing protein [Microcystis sp. M015S2]|uniref:PIN domain-containing protein n=1 Tax=unclassified Microcystis TaxID=2643300 RepID=UPI00258CD822|nr:MULTISPECIES: PIN domain-containing protein [unclassified Microcystis]MCA2708724.1 PIN domain-containing protein [Microcystis sp. M025S2]MCA2741162.1 PIN domain-containing protein [Microcystis sp. M015S2]MCA2759902.1 PIN domain-containing protein [Microcystis sp. M145S2]
MKKLRVYIDTSVIAGCLDDEFSLESNQLMEAIKQEKFILLMSDIIVSELINASQAVKDILLSIPQRVIEVVKITAEVLQLRDAYINEGVVTSKSINDATHVAAATIARADAIISWNFKHIVRLDKMKGYNQINLLNGYGILTIISPLEVTIDEANDN